jgi:hypothetical protein
MNHMPSQLLLPAARGAAPTAHARECRVYERYPCGLPSRCQPASSFGKEDLKWAATLENISQSGVCLNLRRRFEPGTGLTIELPATDSQDAYVVLAKVVHVRRQESGFWFLGCKFISELSEDEMQRLLRTAAGTNEARQDDQETAYPSKEPDASLTPAVKKSRARQAVSQVHLHLEIGPRTSITCVIPHFSAANRWPLVPGTVGTLKGYDLAGAPWKLKVKVRECLSRGDGWNLECRLVKVASRPELLRALGGLLVKKRITA